MSSRILLLKITATLAALIASGCTIPASTNPILNPDSRPSEQTVRIVVEGGGTISVGGEGTVKVVTPSVGSPVVEARPIVFGYTQPNCPPCEVAKREIAQAADLPFRVDWSRAPPDFVSQFPTFHWEASPGSWRQRQGWDGVEGLRQIWSRSRGVATAGNESAPTPMAEVERVLSLLPTPIVGFVDFGCGDGRWCISAAERWGVKTTGVELDPARAAAARERVRAVGLAHLVTIVTGDATTVEVEADVGVAYLYQDVLEKLRPRIEKLKAFASYRHRPPGLPVTQNGDSFLYLRPTTQARGAVWQGQVYSGPVCNAPGCRMCAAIRQALAQ